MFRREKGITLIALVITIIVLLILAGVSISLVLGNNGVLNQATNAVKANREASVKEEIQLAYAAVETEYWEAWANNSSLSKADFFEENNRLKNHIEQATENKANIQVTRDGDKFNVTYGVTDNSEKPLSFIVYTDGKIEEVAVTSNVVELISESSENVLQLVEQNSAAYDLLNLMKSIQVNDQGVLQMGTDDVYDTLGLDGNMVPMISYPSGVEVTREDTCFIAKSYVLKLNDNNESHSEGVTVRVPKNSNMQKYTNPYDLRVMFARNYSESENVENGNLNDSTIILDVTKINSDTVEFVLPAEVIGNKDVEGVFVVFEGPLADD